MTIEEMQKRKEESGMTYEEISRKSGVPLTTVQKVLGGFTKSPRYKTLQALERALTEDDQSDDQPDQQNAPQTGCGTDCVTAKSPESYRRTRLPILMEEPGYYNVGSSAYDASYAPTPFREGQNLSGDSHRNQTLSGNSKGEQRKSGKPENFDETERLPESSGDNIRKYPRQGHYTIEDRNALPGDIRTELIDGVIYEMAAPRMTHQALQMEIAFQLESYIRRKGGPCMCFTPDTDVIVDNSNRTVVMPDILVVCDRDKIKGDAVHGAPDLIIEILSPSTQRKDLTIKYHKYAESGVREYWIVDPRKRKIVVYRLDLINQSVEEAEKAYRDPEDREQAEKIAIYGFDAEVPVGIYGGDCKVDFKSIYERLKFMYER